MGYYAFVASGTVRQCLYSMLVRRWLVGGEFETDSGLVRLCWLGGSERFLVGLFL
jgi:hypothetical protein